MAHEDLLDKLVATVRTLNLSVRAQPEAALTKPGADGVSVRDLIVRLRDSELRFSQALKERLTGVPIPDVFGAQEPVVGTESAQDSTNSVLSQFVTARESVLAMLHPLSPEDWDQPIEGGTTIAARIQELIGHDRQVVDQIKTALGAKV